MPTAYTHRYFIFVTVAKDPTANQQAKAWDPDTGGDRTFGDVRLSADGAEPPTHFGCNTAATEGMRTKILDALANVPFYRSYREADGWTWETALADAGLKLIVPADRS